MALYIEPYPGSGIGLLDKTYKVLVADGEANGYQVEVCRYGYPPIYVKADPAKHEGIKTLVLEEIAKFVDLEGRNLTEKVTPDKAKKVKFEIDKHWAKHGEELEFNPDELSEPLPHLAPAETPVEEPEQKDDGTESTPSNKTESETDPKNTKPESEVKSVDKDKLINLLVNDLTENELRVLCNKILVNYDKDLQGDVREVKVRELVDRLERRKKLDKLIEEGRKLYPDMNW